MSALQHRHARLQHIEAGIAAVDRRRRTDERLHIRRCHASPARRAAAFSAEKAMPPSLMRPLAKMSRSFSFAVTTATLRPARCACGKIVSARRNLEEFIITSSPLAVS